MTIEPQPTFWAAPDLAKAGYPVFPLKDKEPSVSGGFYACTLDLSQVAEWITEGREHHDVAVATGLLSGVVVLDADAPEAFEKMRAKYGEPNVRTQRGGHWYFAHPRNGKVTSTKVGTGLDRKGDGGYVAAPPSRGRRWTNGIPDRTSLPVLPREFWPKKAEASGAPRSLPAELKERAAEALARHVRAIAPGSDRGRHEHLRHLCGVLLARGVAFGDAEDVLIAGWTKVGRELAERAPREVPNTLRTTEQALAEDRATGVPSLEAITPGLYRELEEVFGWVRVTFGHERNGHGGAENTHASEAEGESEKDRRNQGDRLIGYALEELADRALFADQHGAPHALVTGEPVPLTSRCYSWLRRLMWEEEERAVNGEYLKTAAGTLAAHAEFSGEVRELHTRAAWHEGTLYYELGRGRVVRTDGSGWSLDANPPVLFRRFPNLKPLPDPQPGGSLQSLAGLVNLKTERDQRLFLAYLVTLPLPHVGRPILNAAGAMGSGKTTLARVVKRLLDPTAPEAVRFEPRDFLQKAAHASIVMLDNQNTVPEWAADTLCRLVTGEADSKRKLYTDDEDVIVELRRAVLLNGINVPTDRGDVLDRSLVVELERISDGERRTEEELWERFEAQHPNLLGAVFDLLAKAMACKPSTKLSRRPRLADWGEYAAAVYEVMGWGAERFLADWNEIVRAQNQATLDGSPVAQAVIKFMEDKAEYSATSSELHKKLEGVAESLGVAVVRDKEWPKSARWLWRRIKEVLSLLVAAGIEASREEDKSGSRITLRKLSKTNATNATEGESGLGKPKTGGIKAESVAALNATTGESNATGGNTNESNATSNTTSKADTYADSGKGGNSGNRNGGSWENDPMRFYDQGRGARLKTNAEEIDRYDWRKKT